jgi:hypothetical protein
MMWEGGLAASRRSAFPARRVAADTVSRLTARSGFPGPEEAVHRLNFPFAQRRASDSQFLDMRGSKFSRDLPGTMHAYNVVTPTRSPYAPLHPDC